LIFVYPIQDVIRIRTGERGREALTYAGDIDDRQPKVAPPPAREPVLANGVDTRKK
jgi:hypothetical protein